MQRAFGKGKYSHGLPSYNHELSAEIAPLVRRIFRVFRVDPMTVRLIDLFDGSSYTLPRNLIKKLYITDIIHLICNEQAFQGEREFGP